MFINVINLFDIMKYADVHAHINEEIFDKDRKEIMSECSRKGICIINCSGTPEGNRRALKLKKEFKELNLCLGIYPVQCAEMTDKEFFSELEFIKEQAGSIVGIGEVGLDFYWIKDKDRQKKEEERFKEIIWLANKLKIPLNVHTRDAETKSVNILIKTAKVPVVLHSYGGDISTAELAVKQGFYFSIPQNVVYNKKKQKLVETIPSELLLTETDCPYLGPEPGKRNDPRNVVLSVKKISEIKNLTEEMAEKILFENAKKVFGIK